MPTFLLLFGWIGLRLLRSVWLYALIAIAGYQLGAWIQPSQTTKPARATALQAKRPAAKGYIEAPGFHFHD